MVLKSISNNFFSLIIQILKRKTLAYKDGWNELKVRYSLLKIFSSLFEQFELLTNQRLSSQRISSKWFLVVYLVSSSYKAYWNKNICHYLVYLVIRCTDNVLITEGTDNKTASLKYIFFEETDNILFLT